MDQSNDPAARLRAHQAALGTLLARALDLVERGSTSTPDLARLRWELLRAMRSYQLFKHNELFDPAIACDRPLDASLARMFKARCLAASERYEAHARHWSGRDVAALWGEYVPAMQAMCGAIRAHLDYEGRHLPAAIAAKLSRERQTG